MSEKTQTHRFLFKYRNTPHSSTNVSPASLLFRKLPSTKLARCKPNCAAAQRERQARPQPGQGRHFVVEDTVLVLNTRNGSLRLRPLLLFDKGAKLGVCGLGWNGIALGFSGVSAFMMGLKLKLSCPRRISTLVHAPPLARSLPAGLCRFDLLGSRHVRTPVRSTGILTHCTS